MRKAAILALIVAALAALAAVALFSVKRGAKEGFSSYTGYEGDVYGAPLGCSFDAPCPSGQECRAGACKEAGKCDESSCPDGKVCHSDGLCGSPCDRGDPSSCPSGQVCRGDGRCGPPCERTGPNACPTGEVCLPDGTCGPPCGPATCPSGQVCGPEGLCGAPCDGNDSFACPAGQVCGLDGLCGPPCDAKDPGFCPDGQVCRETGKCDVRCDPDDPGACPAGQACRENGLCGCDPLDPAACPTGQACRDDGACGCDPLDPAACPDGKLCSESGECVDECDPADPETCPDGKTCESGLCGCPPNHKDDNGLCVECGPGEICPGGGELTEGGCKQAWPSATAAALVDGIVIRLYTDVQPCRVRSVFEMPMKSVFGFEDALRQCIATKQCDGLWTIDGEPGSRRGHRAIGFAFAEPGGKSDNGSRPVLGHCAFLKEGPGSCGDLGRTQRFGACEPLASVAAAMEIMDDGTVVYRDRAFCNGTPIRFKNTGLKAFNFPTGADGYDKRAMIVRKESDAMLCKQLCAMDVRCDAVETTGDTCRMFNVSYGKQPSVVPAKGVDTTFVRFAAASRLTKGQVLREIADPADTGKDYFGGKGPIRDLRTKVWDQYDDRAWIQNLLVDGLHEGHEYTVTLEGPAAETDAMVTVKWDKSVSTVKIVRQDDGAADGFIPAKNIQYIRFTAPRLGHLRDFVWLEDVNGMRSTQTGERPVGGKPRGTVTTFEGGVIDVRQASPLKASEMSHGSIVFYLASNENTVLPSAGEVMEALQLSGVFVVRTGLRFSWKPIADVGWKGDGRSVIKGLKFPELGEGSSVAIFAGPGVKGIVPVSRIESKGGGVAVRAPPEGYDVWYDGGSNAGDVLSVVESDFPTVGRCAIACDGAPACTAFRVTPSGCDVLKASKPVDRWSPSVGGVVYARTRQ